MSDRDDFKGPSTNPHPSDRGHGVYKDEPSRLTGAIVDAAPFPKETTDAMELTWWRSTVGPRLPAGIKVFGPLAGAPLIFAPNTGEDAAPNEEHAPIVFVREAGNNEEAFWEDVYLASIGVLAREGHSSKKADIIAAAYADRAILSKRARREPPR